MAKRKPHDAHKLREDANETAYRTLQEAIGERPKTLPPGQRPDALKDAQAVRRGREGGKRGGKARAAKLSPEKRAEIARRAAKARWRRDQTD